MRRPSFDMTTFKERRDQLAKLAPKSAIIVCSHPEYLRNHDVHHSYRQDSNFFYLTGFEEPESILVFRPGRDPEYTLFVRPKDPLKETWDGFRYGEQGTKTEFHADRVFLMSQFDEKIVELLGSVERLYYRWGIDEAFDRNLLGILHRVRASHGRTGRGCLPVFDSWELIGEMRIKKNPDEVETLRRACEISAKAHIAAMKFARPGVNENQVKATLLHTMLMEGAQREGYGTIVASGASATTLHYVFNDQECKDGDLLLIDAGAEYNYYTGDITRTFPVNGRFTSAQKEFYERVLQVQKTLLAMLKPGLPFAQLQETTVDLLTQVMIDLGLLKGAKSELIANLSFKKYYPHGVGHWLGMDVHDVGLYVINGESRLLEPGMCFTVEPGLYVPADDLSAPPEWRGLGVRIEDNVLITAQGSENLTAMAPKEVSEIEAIVGQS